LQQELAILLTKANAYTVPASIESISIRLTPKTCVNYFQKGIYAFNVNEL